MRSGWLHIFPLYCFHTSRHFRWMSFAFASAIWGYHAALGCRVVAAPRACCVLNARFDALVSERRVRDSAV